HCLDDIPISALLCALIVLLGISAFFSISETSMMALNRYRLRTLALKGHRGARLTARLLEQPNKLLGVILLGNNFVNSAAVAIATVIAFRLWGDSKFALSVGTVAVTFLILIFSEITPKVIGAAYAEAIALPASFALTPLLKLFYPVVWFVNLFVNPLLWLIGRRPFAQGADHSLTMDELRTVLLESAQYIPGKQLSILLNLFGLENITVEDVMTPRSQIEAIDIDGAPEQMLAQLAGSHHTRLPVYRGELNNMVGMLHVRNVLRLAQRGELDAVALRKFMREPYFVPPNTSLLTQLQHFQENQRRTAMVVDEYGELQGMVSVEDILEEIVGEFTAQSPLRGSAYAQQTDGSWLVDGGSLLRDLNRKLGLNFPLEGPKTLNGLILEHLEDIPEPGTGLKIAAHSLEIIQTQDRVVKVARIFPPRGTTP
ncbi:MAG: HlyC/CorC family transporter, partial [Burkholderiales bacterium]